MLDPKDLASLSAPAILIVWTLREVFSYLLKTQNQKKADHADVMAPLIQTISRNIEIQSELLRQLSLQLKENSVRLEILSDHVTKKAG